MKEGTLHSDTDYAPPQRYRPHALWLQQLHADKKLTYEHFLQVSAEDFPIGHAARKRDVEEAMRDQKGFVVNRLVRAREPGARSNLPEEAPTENVLKFVLGPARLPQQSACSWLG